MGKLISILTVKIEATTEYQKKACAFSGPRGIFKGLLRLCTAETYIHQSKAVPAAQSNNKSSASYHVASSCTMLSPLFFGLRQQIVTRSAISYLFLSLRNKFITKVILHFSCSTAPGASNIKAQHLPKDVRASTILIT